ncbi:MAG: hypothetical protein DMD35_22520 [Gemmatimonadetes bacterium]|nr:MAG: hypothetical protein DMD35_22520 [Gemmatimonadota bacterium]
MVSELRSPESTVESRQGNHEPAGSARDRAPAPPHQRIGELVAAITHDLRQPMTAVELNVAAALHLLRLREPRTSDAVAALVDAQQQHHRLKDAVRAMHSLLEPRAPFQASVDAVAIAWEVVRLAGLEARSPSVSLRLMIAPPIPVVAADAVMMREALVIIVLGALEAAARRASSGAVDRRDAPGHASHRSAARHVGADGGTRGGRRKRGHRDGRGDRHERRAYRHTMAGGQRSGDSEHDERRPARAVSMTARYTSSTGSSSYHHPGAGTPAAAARELHLYREPPLVLVVDDHEPSRSLARIVLERAGLRVEEAATGGEGLRLAQSLRPAVMLLDIILPEIDGWALARLLRQDVRTRDAIILALTALTGVNDGARSLACGFDEVLTKPVLPRALAAIVARHVADRQLVRHPAR